MLFTRTSSFEFPVPKEHLRHHLLGDHVQIHDTDFEVMDRGDGLRIIPRAEDVTTTRTMPVTFVEMREERGKTRVIITSRLRRSDAAGPLLVPVFCIILIGASLVLWHMDRDPALIYGMCTIALLILALFIIRMQLGYFGYVRRIQAWVDHKGGQISRDVRRQLFKHKLK